MDRKAVADFLKEEHHFFITKILEEFHYFSFELNMLVDNRNLL